MCCAGARRNVGEKESRNMRLLKSLLVVVVVMFPLLVHAQESYCTLEDALWGNEHQSFNDVPIPALLDSLIPPGVPLTVGIPGRSVSFADGSEPCILAGLPAGGSYGALTGDFVDAVVDTECVLPEGFPANRKGKFNSSLLGETIALSLNVRLDPDLASVEVTDLMLTVQALPGEDGLSGTADDSLCAECDTMTVRIPEDVLAAISDSMGVDPTVSALLDLANASLAGETYGVAYKYVWKAVKNINRAFKDCRFLVGAEDIPDIIPIVETMSGGSGREAEGHSDAFLSLAAEAGLGDVASVRLSVPETSELTLAVYTVAGRRAAAVVERTVGEGETVLDLPSGGRLRSGVYFVRAVAEGVQTGRTATKTVKLIVVR